MAMPAAAPFLAYLLPSGQEFLVLLLIGILLFGRRLPEVGRQIGRVVADLRRGVDSFKRELAQDESLRDARSGLRDLQRAARAPRDVLDAPRRIADPKRLFEDLTDESLASSTGSLPGPIGEPAGGPAADSPSKPGG
jgi:sec-independent protein translocase protein TatA